MKSLLSMMGQLTALKRFAANVLNDITNIKIIQAKDDAVIYGKANALAQGIEAAKGEIILITDADCTVPRTWVEQTANRYDSDVGLIGGFTLQKATTPFEGMQSLDWTFILGMAAATAGLGPSSWEVLVIIFHSGNQSIIKLEDIEN